MKQKNRVTPEMITSLGTNQIFVFGSNEAGIHGAGAARMALKWGARSGQGFGAAGNTFAIPTKDWKVDTLPKDIVEVYVKRFIAHVRDIRINDRFNFMVTPIGTGLAGFSIETIAPMFKEAITIDNIYLPESFWDILNKD